MTSLLPAVDPDFGRSTRTRMVLDTSVLIADPTCVTSFDGVDVVIPLIVVEELDGLKTRPDDVGRAARTALRTIEELRVRNGGSLAEAVPLGTGSLQIELNGIRKHLLVEHGLDPASSDNRIIGAALGQAARGPTTMVSNDAALRIKAAHLGVAASEHLPTRRLVSTQAAGWSTIEAAGELIDALYADGERAGRGRRRRPRSARTSSSSCVPARSRRSPGASATASSCSPTPRPRRGVCGPAPRSSASRSSCCSTPAIEVVALDGRAGTGKTLLAVAAGLEQVVEQGRYERLAIYRPLVPVGRADVGFLPGGLDEKLDPWMAAIHDAVVALTDHGSNTDARRLIDELTARGQLSLESVTFLRGRSLQRQLVIIDEAQNLEPTTLRTILTRVGQASKVVFTGDTSQIDAPYLGESNNALAVLTQAFSGQSVLRPRHADGLRAQ